MESGDKLFEGVGKHAHIDHVAVQSAFGMLTAATTLFWELGYTVHPTRKAEGDWGKAIFLVKDGSVPIQLTDSSKDSPVTAGENHIGVMVDDPFAVSMQIRDWAVYGGMSVEIEEVPGGKYFVSIPQVLTVPIELVPDPDVCPECRGRGEIRRGREGQGFDYPCKNCDASGRINNLIRK